MRTLNEAVGDADAASRLPESCGNHMMSPLLSLSPSPLLSSLPPPRQEAAVAAFGQQLQCPSPLTSPRPDLPASAGLVTKTQFCAALSDDDDLSYSWRLGIIVNVMNVFSVGFL